MKNIRIYFGTLLLMISFSCELDRNFVEFKDLEHGAFARLINGVNGDDFPLLPAAAFNANTLDFTVEFYDDKKGTTVETYSWTVTHIPVDGSGNTGPANLISVSKANFGTSPSGLPSATISFTGADMLAALGMTNADLKAGDQFDFQATLTTSKGQVFTSKTTDDNLEAQPAFKAFFQFRESIACPSGLPIDVNLFVGDYSALEPGYGTYDVTFTLESTSPPQVRIDNFWDFGGTPYFEFDTNPATDAVTIPTQDVVMGGVTYVVAGSGTVNKCTGQMVVDYTVRRKSDNALFDDNTHTYTKK